ncbi:MAG: hypothetical protein WDN06_16905 [Asticcacaulis sp.]
MPSALVSAHRVAKVGLARPRSTWDNMLREMRDVAARSSSDRPRALRNALQARADFGSFADLVGHVPS